MYNVILFTCVIVILFSGVCDINQVKCDINQVKCDINQVKCDINQVKCDINQVKCDIIQMSFQNFSNISYKNGK